MAGDDGADVLDAENALDRRQHEVAELAEHADDDAEADAQQRILQPRADEDRPRQQRHDDGRQHERADGAGNRLVGAGVRQQLRSAQRLADAEGEHIVEADREQNQQQQRPIVPVIGHVGEMAERRAEEEKCEHREADALDVAGRAIRRNRADRDETDRERRDRDEEAVPVIERRERLEQDSQHHEQADDALAEQARDARVLAVAEQRQHGRRQDRPGGPGKNRKEQQRHDHRPRRGAQPQFPFQCWCYGAGRGQHQDYRRGEREQRHAADSDPLRDHMVEGMLPAPQPLTGHARPRSVRAMRSRRRSGVSTEPAVMRASASAGTP